jgi:hypothetical protein
VAAECEQARTRLRSVTRQCEHLRTEAAAAELKYTECDTARAAACAQLQDLQALLLAKDEQLGAASAAAAVSASEVQSLQQAVAALQSAAAAKHSAREAEHAKQRAALQHTVAELQAALDAAATAKSVAQSTVQGAAEALEAHVAQLREQVGLPTAAATINTATTGGFDTCRGNVQRVQAALAELNELQADTLSAVQAANSSAAEAAAQQQAAIDDAVQRAEHAAAEHTAAVQELQAQLSTAIAALPELQEQCAALQSQQQSAAAAAAAQAEHITAQAAAAVAAAQASEAALQQQLDSAAAMCCDLQEALVREQSAHAVTQQLAVEHLASLCCATTAQQHVQQVEVGESPLQLQQLQTVLDEHSAVLRDAAAAAARLREAVQLFLCSGTEDDTAAAIDATDSNTISSNSMEQLAEALTHRAQAVTEQLNHAEIGRITLEEQLCTVNSELLAVQDELSVVQRAQADLTQQLQLATEERDKLSEQVQLQQQKQQSMAEAAVQVSPLVSASSAQTEALQHDAATVQAACTLAAVQTDTIEALTKHATNETHEVTIAEQQRLENSSTIEKGVEFGASPTPRQQHQRSSTATDKIVQSLLQQQQQHRHRPPLQPSPTARLTAAERTQQQEQQHYHCTAESSDGEEQQQHHQLQQLSYSSVYSEDYGAAATGTSAGAVNVTATSTSSSAPQQRQQSQQLQLKQQPAATAAAGTTDSAALQQRLLSADTALHRLTQALQEQRAARARAEQRAAAADSTVAALRAQASTDRAVLKRLQNEADKARHLCSSVASQLEELKLARQQLAAGSAVQSTLQQRLQQCEAKLRTAEAAAAAATSELEALPRDALVAQAELRCVCSSVSKH